MPFLAAERLPLERWLSAAVRFDYGLADGQSKACATGGAGARGVSTMESLEEVGQFSGAMPGPVSLRVKRTALASCSLRTVMVPPAGV